MLCIMHASGQKQTLKWGDGLTEKRESGSLAAFSIGGSTQLRILSKLIGN